MTSMLLFVTETYCGWSYTRNFLKKLTLCLHGDHYVKEIEILQQRHWGISGLEPPPDRPVCGFFNELCNQQGTYFYVSPFSPFVVIFMSLIYPQ